MPQFNYLNLADTAGRGRADKQAFEMNEQGKQFNAMKMDAHTEEQKLANTKRMTGSMLYSMQLIDSDPERALQIIPQLRQQGIREGWVDPSRANVPITMEGLPEIRKNAQLAYDRGMMALGEVQKQDITAEDTPYAQRNPMDNSVTQVGATPRGPTSPQANYAERMRLVGLHGEGSNQVRIFDSYVRAPQYQTINQVPTQMAPGGNQPLSTLDETAAAAARVAGDKEAATQQAQTDAIAEKGAQTRLVKLTNEAPATFKAVQYAVTELDKFTEQAQKIVDHPGLKKATGFGGETLSGVPGTEAADAAALVNTLKSKAFISALSAMRASSKTGGAVGNVSDAEGGRFENAFVSLSQAQSYEQFVSEMNRLISMNGESKTRLMDAYQNEYGEIQGAPYFPGYANLPQVEKSLEQARQALLSGRSSYAAVAAKLAEQGIDPKLLGMNPGAP